MTVELGPIIAAFIAGGFIAGIVMFLTMKARAKSLSKTPSEDSLQVISDLMPQMTWVSDVDGTVTYSNERWCEYLGLAREEIWSTGWAAAVHPDDLGPTLEICRVSKEQSSTMEMHYRLKNVKTGEYEWHLARAVPELDEQGQVRRWLGSCMNMHDFKLSVDAIQQSESLFSSVFNVSPYPIVVCTPEGRVERVNAAWLKMWGVSKSELV
ncbi:MAG: PAS domain S-box protein, partial [Proteobacteria bacterium]